VNEEELESWQANGQDNSASRRKDTEFDIDSALTREIVGAGPIFIKKSTDFKTNKRPIRDDGSETTYKKGQFNRS
jgi:hypothetical protein